MPHSCCTAIPKKKKAEYDKRFGSTKRVVVAKEDIAEMQTIYDTMLETKEMPADFIQPDSITIPDEIIGNVAAVPIRKGQMVVKNALLTRVLIPESLNR